MGTHQELIPEQIAVLEIIMNSIADIEKNEREWEELYSEIYERHDILSDEFDEIVEDLIDLKYLDKNKKPTIYGRQYINILHEKAYLEKTKIQEVQEVQTKKTNNVAGIIVGAIGVVASIATILGFIFSFL